MQQLAYPLRIVHSGQFYLNTPGALQTLNVGLRSAETVDPSTKDIDRAVDRSFYLFVDDVDYLFVGGTQADATPVSSVGEDLAQ